MELNLDALLIVIATLCLAVAVSAVWLARWLKSNYPKSYDDPSMAALGGMSALAVTAGLKLPTPEPYNLMLAMLPIFLVVSFMAARKTYERIACAVASVSPVLLSAGATYWGSFSSWLVYTTLFIVFCSLWLKLFRWRYVHAQTD